MRRLLLAFELLAIAVALLLVFIPPPSSIVERYYSNWFYPAVQARLTSWSNDTGVAIFDFILFFLVTALVVLIWRAVASALRQRSMVVFLRGALAVGAFLACVYLWFATTWGLNYARRPLEASIGFSQERVTADAVRALAERAVQEANRAYQTGHAAGFPQVGDMPASLVSAFHDVERRLGRTRATVPGRPKKTVLSVFFRASGTDGMHAPFMLETLLNPDLTGPERPAVLAHEWAHLAGYAPEDDASFVGLLAALHADPGARYSAWLTLVSDAASQLPRADRTRVLARLEPGPRSDQQAIVRRLQSRVKVVERASWQTYDRYLKAQGVREGLQSYSRVVQLLVGSGAIDW